MQILLQRQGGQDGSLDCSQLHIQSIGIHAPLSLTITIANMQCEECETGQAWCAEQLEQTAWLPSTYKHCFGQC